MAGGNVIRFPGRLRLKFVPSKAGYYIKCPYFLYLSNVKDIYIPYPQSASRKGTLFERHVIRKTVEETGYGICRAARVEDILKADGLYVLNKKVDTEFYTGKNVGLEVGMLKPDLILSEKTGSGVQITVLEIKNTGSLMPHHYLQAYVYKLTLERFLSRRLGMAVHVAASMIHMEEDFAAKNECEEDFEAFRTRISGMNINSLVLRNFINQESEIELDSALQRITSLEAETSECSTCPAAGKCKHSE